MQTTIINSSLPKRLSRRLRLTDYEQQVLQRKFNAYKKLSDPSGFSHALQGWKHILSLEENQEKKIKEVEEAKKELASEIANIVNKYSPVRVQGVVQRVRKVAGISLGVRAIEDLVGTQKAVEMLEAKGLRKTLAEAYAIAKKVFRNDTFVVGLVAAGISTIAFGGLAVAYLLYEGITAGFMLAGAGFAVSSGMMLGMIGLQTRHMFHTALLSKFIKLKKSNEE